MLVSEEVVAGEVSAGVGAGTGGVPIEGVKVGEGVGGGVVAGLVLFA